MRHRLYLIWIKYFLTYKQALKGFQLKLSAIWCFSVWYDSREWMLYSINWVVYANHNTNCLSRSMGREISSDFKGIFLIRRLIVTKHHYSLSLIVFASPFKFFHHWRFFFLLYMLCTLELLSKNYVIAVNTKWKWMTRSLFNDFYVFACEIPATFFSLFSFFCRGNSLNEEVVKVWGSFSLSH